MEQGLTHPSVFTSIQDSRGELWFGTDGGGVCRFNGTDFTYYDKSNGLSGNMVRALYEDSRGNIWIGTENGLDRYDGIELMQMAGEEIGETLVLAINEDQQGRIWIGTQTQGLYCLEEKDSLVLEQFTQYDGLLSTLVFDIDIDQYQRLWLSMAGGINVLEHIDGEVHITRLIKDRDLHHDVILCGSIDGSGNLWFGTNENGVIRVDNAPSLPDIRISTPGFLSFLDQEIIWDICWMQDGRGMIGTQSFGVIHISEAGVEHILNKENGLKTNQVVGITEDDQGGRWFSTMGNGMLRYTNHLFTRYNASESPAGNQVTAISLGGPGQFFVGSDEGLTLYRSEKDQLIPVKHYNKQSGLLDNSVNAIAYREGRLWIGSDRGINLLEQGRISTFALNDELISKNVSTLLEDDAGNLWIGTDYGYNLYRQGSLHVFNEDNGFANNEVQTIIQDRKGDIWMGTLGGLVHLQGTQYYEYAEEDGLTEIRINCLAEDAGGKIWIGTSGGGIYLFNPDLDSMQITHVSGEKRLSSKTIFSLGFLGESMLIAATESGLEHLVTGDMGEIGGFYHFGVNDGYTGAENSLNALWIDEEERIAILGTNDGLVRYMPSDLPALISQPNVRIDKLKMFFEAQDWTGRGEVEAWTGLPRNLVLSHYENHLTFSWISAYYGGANDIEYSYFLEGQSRDWSPFSEGREAVFSGLAPGKYTFSVRVRNKYGIAGNTSRLAFEIKPPFWLTPGFMIAAVILLLILIYLAILLRTRKLKKEKDKLERTVVERTREVVEQKDQVQRQHNILVKQNNDIQSSIHYAERIQKAVIPSNQILEATFTDAFIMLLPQQIVSGDFYWVGRQDQDVIIVAADCTGHGVPGAMMSMMGIGFLNQIVNEEKEVDPAVILNKLREHVISSFTRGEEDKSDTKDGMDMALISYNLDSCKMRFAGAYNPLYLIRGAGESPELIIYDASRMPVGLHECMPGFTSSEVDYHLGDRLYMFSDGFPDQFGGPAFRKFMKKRFKEVLLEHCNEPMAEQHRRIKSILDEWMSHTDPDGDPVNQTDDILVMGIQV